MDTRILIVGYGRMGQLVERLAPECGCQVAGVLDIDLNAAGEGLRDGAWRDVDVAIDFTTPQAVTGNLDRYAALGLNAVVGTTGWNAERDALRQQCQQAGIGVVAAPNFSVGAVLFEAIAAARRGPAEATAGLRRLAARDSSRQEARCAVRDRARHQGRHAGLRIRAADRCGRQPCRSRPRGAYRGLRRAVRDHHAVAQRARPRHFRARRAGRRAMGPRQARVVLHAGCAWIDGIRDDGRQPQRHRGHKDARRFVGH